ncbi:MAG: dodecin family protein [Xanthomonadales bacterium]|nr:dodecin family protein [Xanthomonadales bacterium]
MSVAKVIEIMADSDKSFEDAMQKGLDKAHKSLNNVRGAWIEGQKVICDAEGKITEYRVQMKVTFVIG